MLRSCLVVRIVSIPQGPALFQVNHHHGTGWKRECFQNRVNNPLLTLSDSKDIVCSI